MVVGHGLDGSKVSGKTQLFQPIQLSLISDANTERSLEARSELSSNVIE